MPCYSSGSLWTQIADKLCIIPYKVRFSPCYTSIRCHHMLLSAPCMCSTCVPISTGHVLHMCSYQHRACTPHVFLSAQGMCSTCAPISTGHILLMCSYQHRACAPISTGHVLLMCSYQYRACAPHVFLSY